MHDYLEAQELAEALYRALALHAGKGRGQELDALLWLAVASGVDVRAELPRRLTESRRQGLIPELRSSRAAAISQARQRIDAVLRAAADRHLSE